MANSSSHLVPGDNAPITLNDMSSMFGGKSIGNKNNALGNDVNFSRFENYKDMDP